MESKERTRIKVQDRIARRFHNAQEHRSDQEAAEIAQQVIDLTFDEIWDTAQKETMAWQI